MRASEATLVEVLDLLLPSPDCDSDEPELYLVGILQCFLTPARFYALEDSINGAWPRFNDSCCDDPQSLLRAMAYLLCLDELELSDGEET